MNRTERIYRDRAAMAKKALIKAGYLTGGETGEDLTKSVLASIAIDFLADIYHFAKSNGVNLNEPGDFHKIVTTVSKVCDMEENRAATDP